MPSFVINGLGIGLEPHQLGYGQLFWRAVILFFATLIMMRLAGLRFLAGKTTFDVLVGFILASMLSRAINGSAPFFGTIFAGFVVVLLYRAVAYLTCRFHVLGCLVKGQAKPVIIDGEIQHAELNRHHLSPHDLMEDLRLNAAVDDVRQVKRAMIERNGEISVQCEPRPGRD